MFAKLIYSTVCLYWVGQAEEEYGACFYPATGLPTYAFTWKSKDISDKKASVQLSEFKSNTWIILASQPDIASWDADRKLVNGDSLTEGNVHYIKLSGDFGVLKKDIENDNKYAGEKGRITYKDLKDAEAKCMVSDTFAGLKTIIRNHSKEVAQGSRVCLNPTKLATIAVGVLVLAYFCPDFVTNMVPF
jgi:hypothetical protein